jgi:septal ring factor EnvC (AmiA/AmiB activator)
VQLAAKVRNAVAHGAVVNVTNNVAEICMHTVLTAVEYLAKAVTQTLFPEIQAATEALHSRVALTETEIAELKESIKAKKALVRSWRKAIAAVSPAPTNSKKKLAASAQAP